MELSQLEPSNLIGLALELQWPAMLLGVLTSAVAWANRIPGIPAEVRARTDWISSPAVLVAGPTYLWGCTAAYESIRFFYIIARISLASPQDFYINLWATGLSQFMALFAVLLPGFVTTLAGDSEMKVRDVFGALWAIAAVAADHLLCLFVLSPIVGTS